MVSWSNYEACGLITQEGAISNPGRSIMKTRLGRKAIGKPPNKINFPIKKQGAGSLVSAMLEIECAKQKMGRIIHQ